MIDKLIGPVTGLLDKFIPDADTKAKLAHEIATMSQKYAQEIAQAQLEVNKAEAAHKSLFVACLLYTSPSPRDGLLSRMPSSA